MGQWERAGPITQRLMDGNHPLLSLFFIFSMCVLIQDCNDPKQLLSTSNIDQTALKKYTVQAASFSTEGALPLTFEKNHKYWLQVVHDAESNVFIYTEERTMWHCLILPHCLPLRMLPGLWRGRAAKYCSVWPETPSTK